MLDWDRVQSEASAIVGERPAEYDAATRQNLTQLIDLLRTTRRPAPELVPGYWPTFRVTWVAPGCENLEIEVFGDRYEVYRFFEGKTDIWDEDHQPGGSFSAAFLAELPEPI